MDEALQDAESSNVVINNELSSKNPSENSSPVQERNMEIDDLLLADYVRKYSEEELLLLNDTVLISLSSEPSTSVHETQ